MESIGSFNESPSSDNGFQIIITPNNGHMGLVSMNLFMMAHVWDGSPTGWEEYPKVYLSIG
jgi:hypothetical protein